MTRESDVHGHDAAPPGDGSPSDGGDVQGSQFWPPHRKGESVPGAGTFGMWLFLASLGMSFFAIVIGYAVLRIRLGDEWLPEGASGLPTTLWLSTGILVLGSVTTQWALSSARRDRMVGLKLGVCLTLGLMIAFTVSQAFAWRTLAEEHHDAGMRLFAVTFYLMTGLHAVHVIGGLGLQVWVTFRTCLGHYWSLYHPGVLYSAMYWHFMDGIWLLLFGVLLLGS